VTTSYSRVFGRVKPVIAMVHLGASPGAPLFDSHSGVEGIVENARKDLKALQAAGFDAVMFGNENDRPYELKADVASSATMAYVVGRLRPELTTPFGVNVLWDPISTLAVAAATGASFVREIFTGSYASDMGAWTPDAGAALRYRKRLDRGDLALLYNVSAEFAYSRSTVAASLTGRAVRSSHRFRTRSSSPARSQAKRRESRISKRPSARCQGRRCSPTPGSSTPPFATCSRSPTAALSDRR
jgi:membrane complex biogenesis BtpA family protein